MILEAVPPGQHPMISTTTAWTGSTSKTRDSKKAVRGIIPNWQRKPTRIPQGLFMWYQNFLSSTLQPMENITKATMIVRTILKTKLKVALKLLSGNTQDVPSQIVAFARQAVEFSAKDPSLNCWERRYVCILKYRAAQYIRRKVSSLCKWLFVSDSF